MTLVQFRAQPHRRLRRRSVKFNMRGIIKKQLRLIALLAVLLSVTGTAVFGASEENASFNYVDKLFGYASELYLDEDVSKEDIMLNALKKYINEHPEAMVDVLKSGFSSLDDYSDFFTTSEYIEYVNDINHVFYGIGVSIQKNGEYIEIINCLDGGSAEEAGLLPGDKIYAVDGVAAVGKSVDEVQKMVTGELNTTVVLTVLRESGTMTYTLTRRPVSEDTVGYLILDGNIGYISIENFAESTSEEFKTVLSKLEAAGVTDIILDLRNNPGGYLDAAVKIAEQTVPSGVIVKTIYRQEENNHTYYSTLKNQKFNFAVLINGNTASAAEVLASAMQDSGAAVLIGETSFGKAIIQEMYPASAGVFKLTTGRYITRNGHEIHKKGIDPDIEVINTTKPIDVTKYTEFKYTQTVNFGEVHTNVTAAKERLRVLGYGISELSDFFGEELEGMIIKFQAENALPQSGILDTQTQVALENAFAKTDVPYDRQIIKAYEYFGGTEEQLNEYLN